MQTSEHSPFARAESSLKRGSRRLFHKAAKYRGPVELGWYDFITLFRRSFVGPLWATIQMALWIGMITLIFHERLGESIGDYALYVGLGFFAWDFISWSLGEGPGHLSSKGEILKNLPVDLSEITVRRVSFLFFRSIFQVPVPIFIIILFGNNINLNFLYIVPALFVYLFCSFSTLTLLGVVGVYFRDFEFVIPTLTRFLFFTTPIFWKGDIGIRKVISDYNPLSYFVELVRAPLSGDAPSSLAWMVTLTITLVSFLIALYAQSRFRGEVVYRI